MPDFIAVLIHPGATMRRILDQRRYRWIPLVLLAVAASALRDRDHSDLRKALPFEEWWIVAGIIALALAAGLAICLLLFYGFSWIPYLVGRAFEGTGDVREVRTALAWGLMPIIVSAVYRIPIAMWVGSQAETINPMACGALAIVGALELATMLWYGVVGSATLAEAHRFSFLRGLATLTLSLLTPIILTVTAALALH